MRATGYDLWHLYPISLMCSLSPCQCRQNFAAARILMRACPLGLRAALPVCSKLFAHALPPLALLTQKRDLRFRTLWAAGPLRSCAGCLSCSHQYCGLFSRSGSLAMLDAIRRASSRVRRFIAVRRPASSSEIDVSEPRTHCGNRRRFLRRCRNEGCLRRQFAEVATQIRWEPKSKKT